jgi:hypothetical protein
MSLTIALALALPWLSTVPVVVLVAVAIAAVGRSPAVTITSRWLRLAGTVVVGALAVAGTVWQAREIGAASEPSMAAALAPSAKRARPAMPDLRERVKSLENQIHQLEHNTTTRTLSFDTAKKLADYLSQFGSHSVVVSCTPNDVEAYDYATQLANVLKSANWDARGPEVTTIFGNVQAMGINVYDNAALDGDTAKILLDGLAKFNIPFQTRVAPAQAPADAAVELFVGAQPMPRAAATTLQRTP